MPGVDILKAVKHRVADYLEFRSVRRHRSRLGRSMAPRYTRYLEECRRRFTGDLRLSDEITRAVEEFRRKNMTSFWTLESGALARSIFQKIRAEEGASPSSWNERGQYVKEVYTAFPEIEQLFRNVLGPFLVGVFGTHYKIFYGMLYKSERRREAPSGSELWHGDGGPGTCIIVMFYLEDVTGEDGALQCLPWEYSLAAYRNERAEYRKRLERARRGGRELTREEMRELKCAYYSEQIAHSYGQYVEQPVGPAGLVVAFGNNLLHKGGYPEPGRTRYVCLFHCYPSDRPTPFERYRRYGLKKVESFPKDPAADF